jgi:hypothetical protein
LCKNIDRSIYSLKKQKHVQNLNQEFLKSIAMKKQPEILTTTTPTTRIQLIFLVVIAAIFYRNYSNRRLPSMPPNTLGYAKQALQSSVSELEKLAATHSIFQVLAIAGLLALLVTGIVYIIRTH